MSDFGENFIETTSLWAPASSPSPTTILAMLNQTDDGLNLINEIFSQDNLSIDHNDRSEQRPGLGQRLASRIGFNPPTLDTENISPFGALFRNSIVPSPVSLISPRFSPSALLQSPMFPNSSPIIPSHLNTNYRPPAMVESSDEGNATLVFNNDRPYQPENVDLPPQEGFFDPPMEKSVYVPSHENQVEPLDAPLVNAIESEVVGQINNNLTHHPLNVDEPSQEGFNEIPMEESINITSHESHVTRFGAPLIASFESDVAIEVSNDLMKIDLPPQEDGESKIEEKEEEDKDDKEEDEDEQIISDEALDVRSSSSKRRKFEGSNMIGVTRRNKTQRVILQMECEEENPDDGFRWRKYGRKVVKGNPNPRSYYKCTSIGCKVKKYIERGAGDTKILVIIYDGIHKHPSPPSRIRDNPRPRSQSDSLMSQNQINRTTNQLSGYFPSLGPQTDMMKLYLTGLSMLPNLPVKHHNSGFIYRNEEPVVDVIPDGTRVFNGIINHLYDNFGMRL